MTQAANNLKAFKSQGIERPPEMLKDFRYGNMPGMAADLSAQAYPHIESCRIASGQSALHECIQKILALPAHLDNGAADFFLHFRKGHVVQKDILPFA